jgi:hypothetical protein
MKYLKRYNEELEPDTYRRASSAINAKLTKTKEAGEVWDYADEKEFGVFNMHISDYRAGYINNQLNVKVSSPKVEFYYGSLDQKIDNEDDLTAAEELVDRWEASITDSEDAPDYKLSVTFVFSFIPNYKSTLRTIENDKPRHIQTFAIQLDLCDEDDEKGKTSALTRYIHSYQGDISKIHREVMYEKINEKSLRLLLPLGGIQYGIFADKESARKFYKKLPEMIEPHIGKINNIMSLLGAEGEDMAEVKDLFGLNGSLPNISISDLVDSEVDNLNNFDTHRWFNKKLGKLRK